MKPACAAGNLIMILKRNDRGTCFLNYIHVPTINNFIDTCPILPGCFKRIPPLEQAAAVFPFLSTATAPTVSSRVHS